MIVDSRASAGRHRRRRGGDASDEARVGRQPHGVDREADRGDDQRDDGHERGARDADRDDPRHHDHAREPEPEADERVASGALAQEQRPEERDADRLDAEDERAERRGSRIDADRDRVGLDAHARDAEQGERPPVGAQERPRAMGDHEQDAAAGDEPDRC
jgi:hypothetical protein